jgi:hypothetical protein
LNRRRFLKYAGAASAVAGASALGLDYVLQKPANLSQTTTISTLDQTPPTIGDFQWVQDPSDVHDGTIKFSVSDDSAVAFARLNLMPVFPPEIPPAAIPAEDWVDFPSPIPNATLPSKSAQFSQHVADLEGGKTYTANIIATDTAGNEKNQSYHVPYVREFENTGKLTKLSVIPFYYTWHLPSLWTKVPYTPTLGNYDSHDLQVFDIQLDEITGYGMNTICVEWVGGNDWTVANFKDNLLQNSRLLNTGDVKWFLAYDAVATNRLIFENGYANVDNDKNRSTIISDFEEMTNLFSHPSYRMSEDKRPYIFWYLYRALIGNVKSLVEEIRTKYNLYIVGDLVYWQLPGELPRAQEIAQYVDAISSYSMYLSNPSILPQDVFLSEIDKRYASWRSYADKAGKEFSPLIMPGFDDRLLRGSNRPLLERSPEFFEKQIELAEKYVSESGQIFVCTYNEGPEATGVERTIEWTDTYLQEIRKLALRH